MTPSSYSSVYPDILYYHDCFSPVDVVISEWIRTESSHHDFLLEEQCYPS